MTLYQIFIDMMAGADPSNVIEYSAFFCMILVFSSAFFRMIYSFFRR